MHDPSYRRDAVFLGLAVAAAIGAVALVAGTGAAVKSKQKEPKFLTGQCFNRNGIREPWESNGPDGLIVQKGYKQYLVLFRDEAERRSAGEKTGVPAGIDWFDREHYLIDCPKSWQTHGREGKH